jgi:hypothetical protein
MRYEDQESDARERAESGAPSARLHPKTPSDRNALDALALGLTRLQPATVTEHNALRRARRFVENLREGLDPFASFTARKEEATEIPAILCVSSGGVLRSVATNIPGGVRLTAIDLDNYEDGEDWPGKLPDGATFRRATGKERAVVSVHAPLRWVF